MMKKIILYLDNCCFNRPYDDQEQIAIYLETQAKLFIQSKNEIKIINPIDFIVYIMEDNDEN